MHVSVGNSPSLLTGTTDPQPVHCEGGVVPQMVNVVHSCPQPSVDNLGEGSGQRKVQAGEREAGGA